jgi:hypothetical protein
MSDDIALGQYADQLMGNPAYQTALMMIKGDLFEEFNRGTVWSGAKKRESIYKQMQAVNALEEKIENMMTTGKGLEQMEARHRKLKSVSGI